MRGRPGPAAAIVLLGIVVAVPACAGHAGGGTPAAGTAGSSGTAPTDSSAPMTASPAGASSSASAVPVPSVGSGVVAPSSSRPAVAYCRTEQLAITATRLPGAAGTSYAQVTVVNTSAGTCQVTGYPAVTLLDAAGAPLGGAAAHLGTVAAPVLLPPRRAASTLLQDSLDNCRATVRSAKARIAPPEQATSVQLPLIMASCPLAVRPFTAGTNPAP